jgi:hypothetical protein
MIGDKLAKVNDSYTINRYDNGFMVEVGGRDEEGDWKTSKVICNTEEDLITVIKQVNKLELDN